jgi:hypothetical protein
MAVAHHIQAIFIKKFLYFSRIKINRENKKSKVRILLEHDLNQILSVILIDEKAFSTNNVFLL